MVVELDIKRSASHTRMASDVDEKVAARHRAGSAENEGAVARYVAECDRYRLAPDPAVVTTLATGWWLLEPSRPYGAGASAARGPKRVRGARPRRPAVAAPRPRRGGPGVAAAVVAW